jgi:outer membrane protein OmpA-like peptidoglycan-associated protein
MARRLAGIVLGLFFSAALPVFAQEPGVDAEDCKGKDSKLLVRLPGCGIWECSLKDFDSADLVINKASEMKTLEGMVEMQKLGCPTRVSPLQIVRNAEAALKAAGYAIDFSGKHDSADQPVVTAHKGAQWISVQTGMWNEFPIYDMTAVLIKAMQQEMTVGAQAMADAITKSGRLDVYGITFATAQATITPSSDQVLADVLAVLVANPDWKLRIEGHTDNVGDKAANQKLSDARARAVAAWLAAQGVDATRLTAAGVGDSQPVGDNKTEEGRRQNRRVVLVKQ